MHVEVCCLRYEWASDSPASLISSTPHSSASWLRANQQVLNEATKLLLFILCVFVLKDYSSFPLSELHPVIGISDGFSHVWFFGLHFLICGMSESQWLAKSRESPILQMSRNIRDSVQLGYYHFERWNKIAYHLTRAALLLHAVCIRTATYRSERFYNSSYTLLNWVDKSKI